MENLYLSLPTGDNLPEEVNVVIEITDQSYVKYEYDHELGIMKLDRMLYAPMPFPANYGFIPQCWNSDDNDPADALVFASHPIQMGVLVPCTIIGLFEMIDSGDKDDKIVCIPADDPLMKHVKTYLDLPEHLRKQIEFYFSVYKNLQNKKVEVIGFASKEKALEKITKGIADHKAKFPG